MNTSEKTKVTIDTIVKAPIAKIWSMWNSAEHITKWNAASADWHTPKAENDFRIGGKCLSRMEAKDGSMGFDFEWTYTDIIEHKLIESVLADGRTVKVTLEETPDGVKIVQVFEAETENPVEMQQFGWQAILNSFKQYVETH